MRLYDDADPVRRIRERLKRFAEVGHVHAHSDLTGLGADDHPQYHTEARALAWLGTRTADDLPQGATNLYLTAAERAKLVGGAGSGLDADTLRGLTPAAFAAAIHTHVGDEVVGGTLNGGAP